MDDLLTSYISLMLVTINKQKKPEQQYGASLTKGSPARGGSFEKGTPVRGGSFEKGTPVRGEYFRKGTPVRKGSRKY